MSLAPGTRLGPYEIVAPLGAGGMGEVYRAKDTRLGRDVAVKVLPQHLSSNPEIRARFEREAKTVSSLNHPHICTLHDVGREGETDYLVMELIEGETLAARLAKGALPLPDVLKLGAQIADALGRAHRAGVMHRDLKPGNVMLTKSGAKLMDFGLARATGLGPATEMTSSPTVAGPLTAEGTILGTFQYMAPEQLEGKEADARADLWALGCVLYEMATAKRAFEGATQASLISAIMRDTPRPMAELAPMSPPALERVVRHCLAKDPEDRIQTAHDVKLQLEGIAEPGSQPSSAASVQASAAPRRGASSRERIAWVLVALVTAIAAGLSFKLSRPGPQIVAAAPMRFTVTAPLHARLNTANNNVSISPDGKSLAFVASDENGTELIWIRELGGLTAHSLVGTENGHAPFWSPDGRFLGFFAGGKLRKLALSGGSPEVLCDAPDSRGGSWGRGGDIVFAPQATGGLFRVSGEGGEPAELVHPDASRKETGLRFPQFLPDGKQFVFVSMPQRQGSYEIYLASLASKDRVLLMRAGAVPVWADPDYLVTMRNQRLVVQRFDLAAGKLVGEPQELGDAPTIQGPDGVRLVSASQNGILAYSASRLSNTQVSWFDRAGKRQSILPLAKGRWESVSIAPDGRRALVGRPSSASELDWWLVDLDTASARRFAAATALSYAVWSPAGDRIVFQLSPSGPSDIYVKPVEGGGAAEPLVVSDVLFKNPNQWTPDGKYVTFDQPDPETAWDIWRVPLAGERKPEPLVKTTANEHGGWVSSDGRWVAYTSDESGRDELYVQSYPVAGQRQQLTTNGIGNLYGGVTVHWSRDDRELLLFDGTARVMDIAAGSVFKAGPPRVLFTAPSGAVGFSATADHQRFLVVEPVADAEPAAIELDLNWAAGLEKR
jgi:eukaryotic-like serine/threonine-protein kinase